LFNYAITYYNATTGNNIVQSCFVTGSFFLAASSDTIFYRTSGVLSVVQPAGLGGSITDIAYDGSDLVYLLVGVIYINASTGNSVFNYSNVVTYSLSTQVVTNVSTIGDLYGIVNFGYLYRYDNLHLSIVFVPCVETNLLFIGGKGGLFYSQTSGNSVGTWKRVVAPGTLPEGIMVFYLEFDQAYDILLIGTFGRGVMRINSVCSTFNLTNPFAVTATLGLNISNINLPGMDEEGAWTAIPTKTPTRVPTESPTKPSALPTVAPTKLPSQTPTESPTKLPSQIPTETPSKLPSQIPTETPTKLPSQVPSVIPTSYPSKAPTDSPTKAASKAPTDSPTKYPSKIPTNAPSKTPTKVPTS